MTGEGEWIPDVLPSEDWELNCFLQDVEDMLEDDDFRKMKNLCRGNGGIGNSVLEDLKHASELFHLLRQQGRITIDNLLYLQGLVYTVGRKDIHKKFIEFAQKMETTLHFFAPNNTPENGYAYVKFHIGGDTRKYSKENLLNLQHRVSRLLRVPPQFVYLNGVEPSNSLLITFMIPEDVLYVLTEITDKEKADLSQSGIDYIQIKDEKINLCDITCQTQEENLDAEKENIKLHKKLKMQEMEIQNLQSSLVAVNKEVKEQKQKKNGFTNHDRLKCLELLVLLYEMRPSPDKGSRSKQKVPSCKLLTSQYLMRHTLQKCRELGYEEMVIQQLLESNSIIVREMVTANYVDNETHMNNQLRVMHHSNIWLQYQVKKLRFYLGVNPKDGVLSNREEYFLHHLLEGVTVGVNVEIGKSYRVDESSVQNFLRHLSRSMTRTDRFKLQKNADLTQEEKEYLKQKPEEVLVILKFKEHVRQKGPIELPKWLSRVLTPLNNNDLIRKAFDMMVKEIRHIDENTSNVPQPTAKGKRATKLSAKRCTKRKSHAYKLPKKSTVEASPVNDSSEEELAEEEKDKHAEEINSKLNNLTNMVRDMQQSMQSLKKSSYPWHGFSHCIGKDLDSLLTTSIPKLNRTP